MAALKFLRLVAGAITEVLGTQTSAGGADAGKIVALADTTGKLDPSLMPTGFGDELAIITTSEALAAGDFVNVHNSTGAKVRKADATAAGKHAHGFVLAGFGAAAPATVYFEGTNDQVTGQTPGDVFLQTTPGLAGAGVPSTAGNIVQKLGVAISATAINFERETPITLA